MELLNESKMFLAELSSETRVLPEMFRLCSLTGEPFRRTDVPQHVIKKKGQKLVYIYDYGDNWRHNLVVEEIGEPNPDQYYPVCLGGERACPPEDCGGLWGYYRMLESLRDPDDDEYESYREWVGGSFDPDHFDLEARNAVLARFDEYVSGWNDDGEDWEK